MGRWTEVLRPVTLVLLFFLVAPVEWAAAQDTAGRPSAPLRQPSQPLTAPTPPTSPAAPAQPASPGLSLNISGLDQVGQPQKISSSLMLLLLLTVLSLAPAILMMMTGFVRIVVVLGFVRRAIGTEQVPPNQIVLGLALFLTLFVMAPTFQKINKEALQPYIAGQLAPKEAYDIGIQPVRSFLFDHCRKSDLALFVNLAGLDRPQTRDDIPLQVLVPSFMISELKTAFIIGFVIYIPFLVIDMVVASILLSMGMMMLPPVVVSLPFKILLFVLVDGWSLVVGSLMKTF